MGLTKAQGNMYKFPNLPYVYTWNPIAGECLHKCSYCYVQRGMARMSGKYKGKSRLVEKELHINLYTGKCKPKTVFISSCNDLFGEWIPQLWIEKVLENCREYPLNTYLFQSKNPGRFQYFMGLYPRNSVFCTTIERNGIFIPKYAPHPQERAHAMINLHGRKTITIEPIEDFEMDIILGWLKAIKPEWVSIGADSKHCGLSEPSPEKVRELITELEKFTLVYQKDNLERLIGTRV